MTYEVDIVALDNDGNYVSRDTNVLPTLETATKFFTDSLGYYPYPALVIMRFKDRGFWYMVRNAFNEKGKQLMTYRK